SRLLDVSKLNADDKAALDNTTKARGEVLAKWSSLGLKESAPLWYYVLREAEYYGVIPAAPDADSPSILKRCEM
ncbi:MAG TPA: hypothetical protein VGC82_14600, partial [Rhodopila sp.]